MILKVNPTSSLTGSINLPSSKSYSIRASIIAGCGGASMINNYSDCDDACIALNVIEKLGAKIVKNNNNNYQVLANVRPFRTSVINVNESGTTLRFILPLLAFKSQAIIVEGKGTLIGRPNTFLVNSLRKMGAEISGKTDKHSVPIKIGQRAIKGGNILIDASVSSQFISALFITCPQLEEDSTIHLTGGKVVSTDYIDMTVNVLEQTGVKIKKISDRKYFIVGRQRFRGLKNFTVPSDYGLAAFLFAAASLVKSKVKLTGYFNDSLVQADGAILNFLNKMGVKLKQSNTAIMLQGPYQLKGGEFSLKNCPDLVPIMAVLAMFAKGATRLKDIGHARVKESDRISDLRQELLKVGADIKEGPSDLTIYPKKDYKNNVVLNPHKDHRLAMAFAVLGLKLGTTIENMECSHKSYPGFVRDFKKIGAKVSN